MFVKTAGSLFTGVAGSGVNIKVYGWWDGQGIGGASNVRGLLYLHSDLSLVTNGTTDIDSDNISEARWITLAFSSAPSLGNIDYVITSQGDIDGDGDLYTVGYYDTGDANQGHTDSSDYPIIPNPLNPNHDTNKWSIYVTYSVPVNININDTLSIAEDITSELPDDLNVSVGDSLSVTEDIDINVVFLTLDIDVSGALSISEDININKVFNTNISSTNKQTVRIFD